MPEMMARQTTLFQADCRSTISLANYGSIRRLASSDFLSQAFSISTDPYYLPLKFFNHPIYSIKTTKTESHSLFLFHFPHSPKQCKHNTIPAAIQSPSSKYSNSDEELKSVISGNWAHTSGDGAPVRGSFTERNLKCCPILGSPNSRVLQVSSIPG